MLQILGVGLIYLIAGKLSLFLAIPPGYATAIWPPAGIALVAVLVYGYRVWPGILLGSFFVNVLTSIDTSTVSATIVSLGVPAGIGAGAALQAVASAYLVRRLAAFPNALGSEREVFAFLVWGGPVGCLVNATLGTSLLFVAGIIPGPNFLINFGTWWIGDTIGVLIFTPVALVWLLPSKDVWKPRRLSVTLPILLAFTMTVAAVTFGADWEREKIKLQFDQQAATISQALEKTLDRYVGAFLSLSDFYAGSNSIERHEFKSFVSRTLADLRGFKALSWNPRVKREDLAAFVKNTRKEGLTDFQVVERNAQGELVRVSDRPEYIVVHYIEPMEGNESVLGYDVASNPVRREALNAARDTGAAIATERITLVQGKGSEFGVLVVAPIYRYGNFSDTVTERRQNHLGFVVAVLHGDEIVKSAIKGLDTKGLIYRLYDQSDSTQDVMLFESQPKGRGVFILEESGLFGGRTAMGQRIPLEIGSRDWRLDILPSQEYLAFHRQEFAWVILFAGMLLTALVGAFVLVVSGRGELLRSLVVERTENLQESESRLAQAQRIARLGNWEWDVNSNEVWCSDEVHRIMGIEAASSRIDFETFLEFVHPDDRDGVRDEIDGALRSRAAFNIEHRVVPPRGQEIFVHQQGQTSFDNNGQPSRVIGTIQDITGRRQLDKMKNELISTISHELRTPLTSIRGSLGLVASGALGRLPAKINKLVDIAYKNSDRLANLVDEILDMEKIDSGYLALDLQRLNLSELVAEAVDANSGYAREFGVDFVLTHMESELVVNGDDSRLTQVVANLLSNAAKFSPKGAAIEIAVTRNNGSAMVSVSDVGPGIPVSFHDQVFGRFTQADTSNNRNKGGTGLGLNISRSIVERHGGNIGFESIEGNGSTFYFTMPTV